MVFSELHVGNFFDLGDVGFSHRC